MTLRLSTAVIEKKINGDNGNVYFGERSGMDDSSKDGQKIFNLFYSKEKVQVTIFLCSSGIGNKCFNTAFRLSKLMCYQILSKTVEVHLSSYVFPFSIPDLNLFQVVRKQRNCLRLVKLEARISNRNYRFKNEKLLVELAAYLFPIEVKVVLSWTHHFGVASKDYTLYLKLRPSKENLFHAYKISLCYSKMTPTWLLNAFDVHASFETLHKFIASGSLSNNKGFNTYKKKIFIEKEQLKFPARLVIYIKQLLK